MLADSQAEGAQTLTLTLALSNPQGATIGDGEATGTVTDLSVQAPLTAALHGAPPEHDGSSAFTVELRLSEEPAPVLKSDCARTAATPRPAPASRSAQNCTTPQAHSPSRAKCARWSRTRTATTRNGE